MGRLLDHGLVASRPLQPEQVEGSFLRRHWPCRLEPCSGSGQTFFCIPLLSLTVLVAWFDLARTLVAIPREFLSSAVYFLEMDEILRDLFLPYLKAPTQEIVTSVWHGSSFVGLLAVPFLLFGLTWHLLAIEASGWVLFTGFMAIIGSFMLSYTADKYDNLMRERIKAGGAAGLRMGRDMRVFLIFLGAVTNLILPVLVLIAVVMNLETLRRVLLARDA